MSTHNNYEKFQEAKCDLGMTDIVNAFDYIQAVMKFVPKNDTLREDYEFVIKPLERLVSQCLTDATCPYCGKLLFCSDVEGYDYICTECDENFYECEVSNMIVKKNTKKYTIKDCKEFCDNVLVAPPMEEFEDGTLDERQWYEENKIHIIIGKHDMEIDYLADNVTEIDCAINAMYEMEMELMTIRDESDESKFKTNISNAFKTHMFMKDRDKHTVNELLYILLHDNAFKGMDFSITIMRLDDGCSCIPTLDAFVPTEARAMWFEDSKVEFEVEECGEGKFNCITIFESEGV